MIFEADGSVRCRYRTMDLFDVWDDAAGARPDGYSEGVMSTPAIGDIDGDGHDDIVFGGWDNHIHAINRACKVIGGFPFHVDDSVWSSPRAARHRRRRQRRDLRRQCRIARWSRELGWRRVPGPRLEPVQRWLRRGAVAPAHRRGHRLEPGHRRHRRRRSRRGGGRHRGLLQPARRRARLATRVRVAPRRRLTAPPLAGERQLGGVGLTRAGRPRRRRHRRGRLRRATVGSGPIAAPAACSGRASRTRGTRGAASSSPPR